MRKAALELVQKETPPQPATQPSSRLVDMKYLVRALMKYNASDLHLKAERPPLYRINGKLVPAKMAELRSEDIEAILFPVLTEKQNAELATRKHVDLSFHVQDVGRFRCNVYHQKGGLAAAIRVIPIQVPTLDELGVPPVLKEICMRPRGLVLVTGATGMGKSTTLAGMIHYINEHSHVHILSVEEPIEYVHRDHKAMITQREVGTDTHSAQDGLISALRQDIDVLVIGEMRDREMIQVALTAAETGHLVFATLHTNDAKAAIERILDVFPADAQNQIRIQLASTLVAVVSQQLVLRKDGSGRVPACEVMIKSPSIENHIMKNEIEKIPDAIANSNGYYHMQTMNQALEKLVLAGTVTAEVALKSSSAHDDLQLRLSGLVREEGYQVAGQFSGNQKS